MIIQAQERALENEYFFDSLLNHYFEFRIYCLISDFLLVSGTQLCYMKSNYYQTIQSLLQLRHWDEAYRLRARDNDDKLRIKHM